MTGYEALFLVSWGLLVHNPTHALVHNKTNEVVRGCPTLSFKPYPNITDGLFRMDYNKQLCPPNSKEILDKYLFTPQLFNSLVFTSTAIGSNYIDSYKMRRYTRIAGMIVPLVDATFNYVVQAHPSYRKINDYTPLDTKQTIAVGAVIALAWWHTIEVFGDKE